MQHIRSLLVVTFACHVAFGHAQGIGASTSFALQHGLPQSAVPTVWAAPFQAEVVAAEDALRARQGRLNTYGRILPLSANMASAGLWTELANGDRLWRLRVASEGALGVEVFLQDLHLPEGAVLFAYDEAGMHITGPYTAAHHKPSGRLCLDQLPGASAILEYYEPAAAAGLGNLGIRGLGHAYRMVDDQAKAGDCQVDVNCSPESDGWTNERDAVVRIRIVDGTSVGFCSGTLVNNTAQDLAQYVLTAWHCGEGVSLADYAEWKFYWKFQRPNCGSGTALANTFLEGAVRLAHSDDQGGDPIPASFQPYWAGWDATGSSSLSASGVCIHHPSGDEKKVSTHVQIPVSADWQAGGPTNTHWRVRWAGTDNGWGVTEGGSSGSPLFNDDRRIIGTLTGGASACQSVTPGGQTQFDYFGKMSFHWSSNPGDELRDWLDPLNSGAQVLDGADVISSVPAREISSAELVVYPDPADAYITVEVPLGTTTFTIHEATGRVVRSLPVQSSTRVLVHTHDLAPGGYFLRCSDNYGPSAVARFILSR
jgi:hypothetical protein